jgi:hypothetical protein
MVHLNVLPHCINLIDLLTIELPAYQIRAQAECVKLVAEQSNLWKFWVSHEQNLPNWSSCAKYVALIQPCSGCSERVFAMVKSLFGDSEPHVWKIEERHQS